MVLRFALAPQKTSNVIKKLFTTHWFWFLRKKQKKYTKNQFFPSLVSLFVSQKKNKMKSKMKKCKELLLAVHFEI